MEEHELRAKDEVTRSNNHNTAYEIHSVLNADSPEHIVSEVGLILRTASFLRVVHKYHTRLSERSAARLQLVQVFKLNNAAF